MPWKRRSPLMKWKSIGEKTEAYTKTSCQNTKFLESREMTKIYYIYMQIRRICAVYENLKNLFPLGDHPDLAFCFGTSEKKCFLIRWESIEVLR